MFTNEIRDENNILICFISKNLANRIVLNAIGRFENYPAKSGNYKSFILESNYVYETLNINLCLWRGYKIIFK